MAGRNSRSAAARRLSLPGLTLALLVCLSGLPSAPLASVPQAVHAEPTSFGRPILFDAATWTTSVAVGDLDGRNGLDIVVGNRASGGFFSAKTSRQNIIVLNDGSDGFAAANLLGDIDCDATTQTTIRCFGTGIDETTGIALGDIDGENGLDIVVANRGSGEQDAGQDAIYFNDGSGNFDWEGSRRTFGPAQESLSVALGDLDGRNGLDIIVGKGGSPDEIYYNDGLGNFDWDGGSEPFGPENKSTGSIAVGDMNGDSRLDIVVGHKTGGFSSNVVYLNTGSEEGRFVQGDINCEAVTGPYVCFGNNTNTQSVALGDLDGDGDLDVVAGNNAVVVGSNGQGFAYLNGGGARPAFTEQPFGQRDDRTSSVALGDVDNDSDLDIVAGKGIALGTQSAVYLNDGDGNFHSGSAICDRTPGVLCVGTDDITTGSVGVADLNGDGYLDIVTGNGGDVDGQSNILFLNAGAGDLAPPRTGWSYGDPSIPTTAAAVGDLNNDAILDVVVARRVDYVREDPDCSSNCTFTKLRHPSAAYLSDGEGAFVERLFGSGDDWTTSIALGDLDGDRDLDIVVGSIPYFDYNCALQLNPVCSPEGGQNYVYLNNNGTFGAANSVRPFGTGTDWTYSVALGDIDGDTDLDIVVGNFGPQDDDASFVGEQNVVYLNDGAGNFASGANVDNCADTERVRCVGEPDSVTTSVALGDIDVDGDLDIAVGNGERVGQQSAVYLNDGAGNFPFGDRSNRSDSYRPFGASSRQINSLAMNDLDGDGYLDIISAGAFQADIAYLNDGTGRFDRPDGLRIINQRSAGFPRIVAADFDSNGTIDVATNLGEFADLGTSDNRVYRNDGRGGFTPGFAFAPLERGAVASGDMDGDGDIDLVTANQIFLNGLNNGASAPNQGAYLTNNPPRVTITHPIETGAANYFATAEVISETPELAIPFTLFDQEGDPVREISATFSLDGGANWRTAVPSATQTTNLATSPGGTAHVFRWNVFASNLFGQSDNVVFRIVAYPVSAAQGGGVPGPYQRPYAAATTFPFRVRGTQVRVTELQRPPTPPVRPTSAYRILLPAIGAQAYAPPWSQPVYQRYAIVHRIPTDRPGNVLSDASARPFRTDAQGFLEGRGEIEQGDRLVALQPIAASDVYTVYLTSARPTESGLDAFRVGQPGQQRLTILPDSHLILFNLKLALEWDARADAAFLARLEADLQRTSELLYDWTNGQAALGDLTIYHDKLAWNGFNSWNDADIRIYASNRIRPNANSGGVASRVFGQIRMGAVWNRYGEAGGVAGEDWPRALAHELGHYLFFLDDNYLGLKNDGLLTPVSSCPGAMSDPYVDDNGEFHPAAGWREPCGSTLANVISERSDWETIVQTYPWLRAPTESYTGQNQGPRTLPLAVTRVRCVAPPSSPEPPLEREACRNDATARATLAQIADLIPNPVFFLPSDDQAAARAYLFQRAGATDASIVDLLDLGRPELNEILARGARRGDRLCVYGEAGARLGCIDRLDSGNLRMSLDPAPGWQPELTVIPGGPSLVQVVVEGAPAGLATTLRGQLFVVGNAPLAPEIVIEEAGGRYVLTFRPTGPGVAGYARIWVEEPGLQRESIAEYGLGGPGAGGASIGAYSPVLAPDGQVLLYGRTLSSSGGRYFTLQPAPRVVTSASCQPQPRALPCWLTPVGQAYRLIDPTGVLGRHPGPVSISFSYLGRNVAPGEEVADWLEIYFLPDGGDSWQLLESTADTRTNIVVAAARGSGIYLLASSIKIPLKAGWNAISYPARQTRPVAVALASIADSFTTAYTAGQDQPWLIYDISQPDAQNTLRELQFGRGYFVYVRRDTTLRLKGPIGSGVQSLTSRTPTIPPPAIVDQTRPEPVYP